MCVVVVTDELESDDELTRRPTEKPEKNEAGKEAVTQ